MFRSLHMKLVLIMLLLITSLMIIVGAFLMTSITGFFIDDFYQQVDAIFGSSNASFVNNLRAMAAQEDALEDIQNAIEANAAPLGIDYRNRNYYILDGESGARLAISAGTAGEPYLTATPNLITARTSIAQGSNEVGDSSDNTASYMDVAIPITGGSNSYIIYIYDNRGTVSDLNSQMFLIIVQALLVGLLISVLLSFLLSKTMITPIERLTEGAERVAAGDFSAPIDVASTDEIGILTTTFNDMAAVLEETLLTVENERNKLDTLFLHMTDGVVAFAGDGSIVHCNPAASDMLERPVDRMDYDSIFGALFPLEELTKLRRPNFKEAELHIHGKFLEVYFAPFDQESGSGVMAVLHDVTAQRKNEEMRKEFVANVSHELRTPLTNIRSYAETLRDTDEVPPDISKSFLDIIIGETDRMTHIVQDLLTLSRLDSGQSELHMTRFHFGDAIDSVCRAVELEAQRHGHALERLYRTGELPMIVGDRDRLEQVMMNVIGNSIKYTPDGGHISVSAGSTEKQVWMEVSDNGIGIPRQDWDRIFDRFYRVDKARSRESGGTGLGLSIARELVARHGGTIGLVEHQGPGTTVRIVLPIRQDRPLEERDEET